MNSTYFNPVAIVCYLCLLNMLFLPVRLYRQKKRKEQEAAAKVAERKAAQRRKEHEAKAAARAKARQSKTPPRHSSQQKAAETEPAPQAVRKLPEIQRAETIRGTFSGQCVAFTGRLPGMTRKEAIAEVKQRGGHAYENMPVCTTLLVVGSRPGMGKLDKADEWIASVRKITAEQFFAMLNAPETSAA